MAIYTVRINNKGEFRRPIAHGTELCIFSEFELVDEGYRDRVEMRRDDFTIPKAKVLIEAKIREFLDKRFDPIEYTVEI